MGHSQASKQASHDRIVQIAARRFRVQGLRGVGVAEVMQEAGLTVGGFYKHFASRDALVLEALAAAFADTAIWSDRARADLRKAVRQYLSEFHRDNPGSSCAITTLLNEADKNGEGVRATYTDRLRRLLALIASRLPRASGIDNDARAVVIYSACVGALAMSRAVSDPRLSRELLNTIAAQLMTLIPTGGKTGEDGGETGT